MLAEKKELALMIIIQRMIGEYQRQGGEHEPIYVLFEAAKRIHDSQQESSLKEALNWPTPPIKCIE